MSSRQSQLSSLIKRIPKAELHLHIEGSLEPELLFSLAKKNNISIPYQTIEEVRKAYNFENLQSFLDLYYQGMNVLLHEEDFEALSYAYMKKMHEQGVCHVEPFFDPQGHTSRGVPFHIVYNGLQKGFRKGTKEFGITVGLIFSFLRHLSEEECLTYVQEDSEDGRYIRQLFAEQAFVAVGLDSSELGNPPEKFVRLYRYCKETLKVPHLVAHAGEEGPPEYISQSLDLLKVDRIDHGVASLKDEALLRRLADSQVPLTVCPLSNYKLQVFPEAEQCRKAAVDLLRKGLRVTLNSDDPPYFGGYMNENFNFVAEEASITRDDIILMAKHSIESSFISDELKQKYLSRIDEATSQ